MSNNYILTADKLCYYYQDGDVIRHILKDVSFNFERGKFYTILGSFYIHWRTSESEFFMNLKY